MHTESGETRSGYRWFHIYPQQSFGDASKYLSTTIHVITNLIMQSYPRQREKIKYAMQRHTVKRQQLLSEMNISQWSPMILLCQEKKLF